MGTLFAAILFGNRPYLREVKSVHIEGKSNLYADWMSYRTPNPEGDKDNQEFPSNLFNTYFAIGTYTSTLARGYSITTETEMNETYERSRQN